MAKYIIGMVASLEDDKSVHREAFINAYKLFCEEINVEIASVSFVWEDDKASREGGRSSAQKLLDKNVDCVIGHFASSAAIGALEVYQNSIPVFLPASTLDELTIKFNNAYRLIGSDADLVRIILAEISAGNQKKSIFIAHDNSIHGINITSSIIKNASLYNIIISEELSEDIEYIVYSGSYYESIKFLSGLKNDIPVIFTDDVVHAEFYNDLKKNNIKLIQDVTIFGYGPLDWNADAHKVNDLHGKFFNKSAGTYFAETYAALQIAFELSNFKKNNEVDSSNQKDVLDASTWDTILGPVRFIKGESRLKNYARWRLLSGELIPQRIEFCNE